VEAGKCRVVLGEGGGLTVVVILVLGRRDVADAAVQPVGVEPVDPAQGGELQVVDAPERSVVADALGLVEPDDGLGQGVVVAVTDAADGRDRPGVASRLP
jgi:hypothetical protein